MDLGPGMLQDADGNYYDPYQYQYSTSGGDAAWQTALGLVPGTNVTGSNQGRYYRKFNNRTNIAGGNQGGVNYSYASDSITPVGDLAAGYSTFYAPTRFMVARRAITQ